MTTERIAIPAHRPATSWAGRASQLRRQQVIARGPETTATSTATLEQPAPEGEVHTLWAQLVEVLDTLDSPATALLCTSDGLPVVSHGYRRSDLTSAAVLTCRVFKARRRDSVPAPMGSDSPVATVDLTTGLAQTVIASIPTGRGRHLLSVTAEGVSMPVLHAWTHETADRLRLLLAAQSRRSSSAAE